VIHGYANAEGELRVIAAARDGELAIVIGDTGPGLVERRDSPGLGLGLREPLTLCRRSNGTQCKRRVGGHELGYRG
jgi:anti-sigma regulatory factor (Ser/Thr protein kinase)